MRTLSKPGTTVSVVIPIHNEEQILRSTVAAVCSNMRAIKGITLHELILSENGSTDATVVLARRLASEDSAIRVLTSDVADYGAAMKAAFRVASGEFIVNFDADYYDFDFVRQAIAEDADVVIGAKNIAGSHDTRALARKLISTSFSWMVRKSLGIRATETHGVKIYRRLPIEPLLLLVESRQDLFDTELIARAELAGLRLVELPITTRELRDSRSPILARIPRTLVGLARLRYRLYRAPTGRTASPLTVPEKRALVAKSSS